MIQPEAFQATLGDRLIGLRYSIDQLELEFAQLAGGFAEGSEWDRDGFNNPSDSLRFNCNMTSQQVWNSVSVGEQRARLAESVRAMELSLPISSASVQRMACDCSVTRVLLSQDSLTIDVGRSKRIVNAGLRKALGLRDKHCRWPGCERPGVLV